MLVLRSLLLVTLAVGVARAATTTEEEGKKTLTAFDTATKAWPCAWPLRVSPTTNNVLLPAANATYWTTLLTRGGPLQALLDAASSRGLEIVGRFPSARYVSFEASAVGGNASGIPVSSVADYQLTPDVPGTNPAVTPGAAHGGTFRLRVVVNGTAAAAAAAAAGETVLVLPAPGAGGLATAVVYRVYGPTPPAGPSGGVPLPSFVRRLGRGDTQTTPTCPWATRPPSGGGAGGLAPALVAAVVDVLAGSSLPPVPDTPVPAFARPRAARLGGLFSGANNAYLAAFANWKTPGLLAVWTAQSSASFPPTEAGAAIPPPRDVRYWSLCLYKYKSPFPLLGGRGCADDISLRPDGTPGRWVVVSGAPEDKPSDAALASAGAVWVPGAGPGDADRSTPVLALFRNILPRAGYGKAVQSVPADGKPFSAAAVMGDAYPFGIYCQKAVFEAGGVAACAQ